MLQHTLTYQQNQFSGVNKTQRTGKLKEEVDRIYLAAAITTQVREVKK